MAPLDSVTSSLSTSTLMVAWWYPWSIVMGSWLWLQPRHFTLVAVELQLIAMKFRLRAFFICSPNRPLTLTTRMTLAQETPCVGLIWWT